MKKKVLITGASGFVGGYLAEHVVSFPEYEIYGTYFSEASLRNSPVKDKITFRQVNLEQQKEVETLIQEIRPDFIFHLAAQANVPISFREPVKTFHGNIDPEIYLFEALRDASLFDTRVLIIGSSEEYGYVQPEELPVDELTPLRPSSPYAVSKIAQDYLALQYHLAYKLPIIRTRSFNHIGPYQQTGFVVADFAKQIADIEKGNKEPVIKVGNLEAKRDFTDVRDIVKAYQLILEKGQPGEVYNIGSGASRKIQEILDILLFLATVKISVEVDPAKLRPSDIPDIICDRSKITTLTGWTPKIPLEQTVKDILDYWRNIE